MCWLIWGAFVASWECEPRQTTTMPTAQSQPQAPTNDQFRARLQEIDQRIAKFIDLRAEFVQTKVTAMLKQPLVSEGMLVVKGDSVRWDTKKPRPSTMTIGGGEIHLYYPEARVMEIYIATGDVRQLTGSPLPRLPVLDRQFEIKELDATTLGAVASDHVIAIELTPKDESLRKHLKSVKVLINTEMPAARKLILIDADGDRTEIEFKNVRVNTGVRDDELELRLPKGIRVTRPAGDRPSSQPAATNSIRKHDP
jgi:outer membrane lipoprotein-sorting protein